MPQDSAALLRKPLVIETIQLPTTEELIAQCAKAAGLQMVDGKVTLGGPSAKELSAEVFDSVQQQIFDERYEAAWNEAHLENARLDEEKRVTRMVRKHLAASAHKAGKAIGTAIRNGKSTEE